MELIGVEEAPKGNLVEVPVKLVSLASSMDELKREGFTAFFMGSVYVYASVMESIPERFAAENIAGRKEPVKSSVVHFDHAVAARCEAWNTDIEVMDNASYEQFKQWMLLQMFVNKGKRNVFVPMQYSVPILDPFSLARGKINPTVIDVYSVGSIKSTVRPICRIESRDKTKSFIDFESTPPVETVVTTGIEVLKTIGE